MCGSIVDIQSPTAEIRRGKKEEEEQTTGWKYNGLPYYTRRPLKTEMLKSNSPVIKPWSQSWGKEGSLWWERFVEEVGLEPEEWKRDGVMDGESGELTEWEHVVGAWTGRTETEGLESGWRTEVEVDSRDKVRYTRRSNQLYIARMMLVVDRGWPEMKSEYCEKVEQRWGGGDMELGWWWGPCKWVRSLYSMRSVILNQWRE